MANEAQYLEQIATLLEDYADKLDDLESDQGVTQAELDVIQQALDQEQTLREHYDIGARFSVIANQLKSLYEKAATQLVSEDDVLIINVSGDAAQVSGDEVVVFVYLFNAHGRVISTWEKFLTQKALSEHSVNRPVYARLEHLQEALRAKSGAHNHAYIEIAVKQQHILADENQTSFFDAQRHPLLRLRQGALHFDKILKFVIDAEQYRIGEGGKLLKV